MSVSVSPSMNKVISTTSFNDLPDETAVEILLKLRLKDLVRSTLVSKTWYSLITNPSFISSQIRNFISSCHDNEKKKLFGEVAPKVEIYSFWKNTWRKLKDPRVRRLVYDHGICVDGCYYWLEVNQPGTERAHGCYGNKMRIMSFDFHSELFGELKVPDNVPYNLGRCPHRLMQVEDSLALCVIEAPPRDKADTCFPFCIWLMRQENGVVTWTLRFRLLLKYFGYPLGITKNGTLIIESFRSNNLDVTCIVSYNIKSMIHTVHGFGIARSPTSRSFLDVSTVDPSFPKSLIMYEGGKSLLKYAD